MNNKNMNYAFAITYLCKHENLSQLELARKIEVSPDYISSIENKSIIPTLDKIIDIANALNIRPYIIMLLADYKAMLEIYGVEE